MRYRRNTHTPEGIYRGDLLRQQRENPREAKRRMEECGAIIHHMEGDMTLEEIKASLDSYSEEWGEQPTSLEQVKQWVEAGVKSTLIAEVEEK